MSREMRVAPEVAQVLSPAMLAQLEATVGDPDNVCPVCTELIDGPSAEAVIFTDGNVSVAKFAHPECMASGVQPLPGLAGLMDERIEKAGGFDMATTLGLRESEPRALIFLELELLAAGPEQDPLELWATGLGLQPVSGEIEEIEPVETDVFKVYRDDGGLVLRGQFGKDTVEADRPDLDRWLQAAAGRAIVIVGRGLGLRRDPPTIQEALALRPCWAAIAEVVDPDSGPSAP